MKIIYILGCIRTIFYISAFVVTGLLWCYNFKCGINFSVPLVI